MKKIILFILLFLPIYVNAQINLIKNFSKANTFMRYNNLLFFYGEDGTNNGLWKTDGTTAGTVFVKALNGLYGSIGREPTVSGNLLYFIDGASKLWRTDGTTSGTFQLTVGLTNADFGGVDLNGILIFVGRDGDGDEIWRSNGTIAGTYKVTDFYSGVNSGVFASNNMVKQGNFVYFTGINSSNPQNTLCRTDGTAAGTQVVANAGKDISNLGTIDNKIVFSSRVDYNYICVGTVPPNGTSSARRIVYVDNGTCNIFINPGTYYTGNYPNGSYCGPHLGYEFNNTQVFKKSGSKLFFYSQNYNSNYIGPNSESLWTTDVSSSQVIKVFTLPLNLPANRALESFYWQYVSTDDTFFNNLFFFVAGDDNTGYEVWRSDGTTAGTFILKDIKVGSESSIPLDFRTVNGITFFTAYDGTKRRLFKTDGTSSGTVEVLDPNNILSEPSSTGGFNSDANQRNLYSHILGSKFIFVGRGTANGGTPALFSVCTTPIAPLVTSSVGSSICVGSSTTLTATGCSGNVSWNTGATTSSITVSPAVNTTYTATCTDVCGVSPSGSFPITVNPLPTIPSISQTGTKIICPRASFSLSASGCNGSTITWSNNTVGSSITVNSANTYTATCTNVCGTSTASSPLIVLEAVNTQTLSGIASAGLSHASKSISSTQTINNTLNVAYQAGNNITLNTDFISDLGSTFNAEIASACPITDGLVASYNMDNNVNDQSGNGHNATFANALVTTGRKGNANGAYSFNGTNQSIHLGTWFRAQEFTISMWLNASPTQPNAYAMIFDNNHGYNISFSAQQDFNTTNQYYFAVGGTPTYGYTGFSLIPNQWEHIVLIKGNGFIKVYKNGNLLGSATHSGLIDYTSTTPALCLGAYVNNGNNIRYWAGKMDDVKIYNRALSDVEVGYLNAE